MQYKVGTVSAKQMHCLTSSDRSIWRNPSSANCASPLQLTVRPDVIRSHSSKEMTIGGEVIRASPLRISSKAINPLISLSRLWGHIQRLRIWSESWKFYSDSEVKFRKLRFGLSNEKFIHPATHTRDNQAVCPHHEGSCPPQPTILVVGGLVCSPNLGAMTPHKDSNLYLTSLSSVHIASAYIVQSVQAISNLHVISVASNTCGGRIQGKLYLLQPGITAITWLQPGITASSVSSSKPWKARHCSKFVSQGYLLQGIGLKFQRTWAYHTQTDQLLQAGI